MTKLIYFRDPPPKTLECDCGNSEEFFLFGPYTDDDELGLRRIFTCAKCGNQLRVYCK